MKKHTLFLIGAVTAAAVVLSGVSGLLCLRGQRPGAVSSAAARHSTVQTSLPVADSAEQDELYAASGFTGADRRRTAAFLKAKITAKDTIAEKEVVYDRILNTEDFYRTLSGSFQRKNARETYVVTYIIQNTGMHRSFELRRDAGLKTPNFSYYDGSSIFQSRQPGLVTGGTAQTSSHIFAASGKDLRQLSFVQLVDAQKRMKKSERGTSMCYYRQDQNCLDYSKESVNPQEMAMEFLNDFRTWKITGSRMVAGRNCVCLQGRLSGAAAKKANAVAFSFDVDKETGVLLRYIGRSQQGKVTDSLVTACLQVNTPVTAALSESAARYTQKT